MQAAFHTKNIGSLVFRPGGSVEVFTYKDRKMTSKNSIEKLYILPKRLELLDILYPIFWQIGSLPK